MDDVGFVRAGDEGAVTLLLDLYFVALVAINAYFLVTVVSNVVYLRRATRRPRVKHGPLVSVIVPARDEERSISRCLESLLAQDYADYEVIVVDDLSGDATARIVASLGAGDERLKLVRGTPLPKGWLGKPHALAQGAAAARGEILILTDADTVHGRGSVSWAVTNMRHHRADILSGYVRQEYGTFGERMIVPTMYAMMLVTPLFLIEQVKSAGLSFAIGQYVAVRREALDAVGGFEAIRDVIVDDLSMASLMKSAGYRDVFLDAGEAARCRLYRGFGDAFAGIRRSVYSAVGGTPWSVAGLSVVVLGVIVGPAAWAVTSAVRLQMPPSPIAVAVGLFAVQWAFLAWDRDVPLSAVLLYPFVFLDLLVIIWSSMFGTGFGLGVDWKGRLVRSPRDGSSEGDAAAADLCDETHKARQP